VLEYQEDDAVSKELIGVLARLAMLVEQEVDWARMF
jgi:hypothetical protein